MAFFFFFLFPNHVCIIRPVNHCNLSPWSRPLWTLLLLRVAPLSPTPRALSLPMWQWKCSRGDYVVNSLDPAYGRGRGGRMRLSKGQSTERFLCQEGGANAKPLWGNGDREREGGGSRWRKGVRSGITVVWHDDQCKIQKFLKMYYKKRLLGSFIIKGCDKSLKSILMLLQRGGSLQNHLLGHPGAGRHCWLQPLHWSPHFLPHTVDTLDRLWQYLSLLIQAAGRHAHLHTHTHTHTHLGWECEQSCMMYLDVRGGLNHQREDLSTRTQKGRDRKLQRRRQLNSKSANAAEGGASCENMTFPLFRGWAKVIGSP